MPSDRKKRSTEQNATSPIFIVGVGASAGGLEAIETVFSNLPAGAPAAYVIALHLSPRHKSLLSTLIGRQTHLKVEELRGDVRPEANVV